MNDSTTSRSQAVPDSANLNGFFSASEARIERWRQLNRLVKAAAGAPAAEQEKIKRQATQILETLRPIEEFNAYPGPRLMARVERAPEGAATGRASRGSRSASALAAVEQLPRRSRARGRPTRKARAAPGGHPAAVGRPRPERASPTARSLIVAAGRALDLAGTARNVPPAAARRPTASSTSRSSSAASRTRCSRCIVNYNMQAVVIVRRLRLSRRSTPLPTCASCSRAHLPQAAGGARSRPRARARARCCMPSGPSSTSSSSPTATSRKLAGADEAAGIRRVFYGARGDARDPPRDPRRHQGPLRDAVLRQPEEVRAAPDRHLPRAADRARQVDLQVELDPRHGRVLRREPVPRRVLGDDRRAGQPARAHRQHQGGAGQGGARLRRRPHVLRHQRHLDVEQDHPPGAVRARRHRADRPRLPQVAPLRPGARRRAAATTSTPSRSRSTRCTAAWRSSRSRTRCCSSRPRASSTACACWC